MNRIAYLLCELKARDFDARLLIAAELLKRGCPVVFGQRWSIAVNAPSTQHGCYVFPTSNAIQGATMAGVANAGHIIVAADEEALSITGDTVLLTVAPPVLDRAVFITHSAAQHDVLRATYPQADVRLCGSARVDLLRQKHASPRFAPRDGYVLFNTNFPLTNGLWGDRAAAAEPMIKAGLHDIPERFEFEEARKAALMPVILRALDELPSPIVIRPHPAEKPAFWQDLVRGRTNAEVVIGESPGPWMASARIVVHADCTTGLEAALMGRPALNISTHPWGARYLMRDVNHTVSSPEVAWTALNAFLGTDRLPEPKRSPEALFPERGATRIADLILSLLEARQAEPLSGHFRWDHAIRPDVLKQKFTVSRTEMDAQPALAGLCAAIHEIDDSTFLLLPKKNRTR